MKSIVVSTKAPKGPRGETFFRRQAANRREKVSPLGVELTPSEAEGALGRDDDGD
jgi:hypothetical protein